MKRMGWIEWIWTQAFIPLASGVMVAGILGLPFSFHWLAITHTRALIVVAAGIVYVVFCFDQVRRRLKKNGVLPPYSGP